MVGGSVAVIFYGEPRLTHDVDLIVFLTPPEILRLRGFRTKRAVMFEGQSVVLAPPEYVIIRKLEYLREGGSAKHLRDIRSMLAVSKDQVELREIEEWVNRLGLSSERRKAHSPDQL